MITSQHPQSEFTQDVQTFVQTNYSKQLSQDECTRIQQQMTERIRSIATEMFAELSKAPPTVIQPLSTRNFRAEERGIQLLKQTLEKINPSCQASIYICPPLLTLINPLFAPVAIFAPSAPLKSYTINIRRRSNSISNPSPVIPQSQAVAPQQNTRHLTLRDKLWQTVLEGSSNGKIKFLLSDGRTFLLHREILSSEIFTLKRHLGKSTTLKLPTKVANFSPTTYESAFALIYFCPSKRIANVTHYIELIHFTAVLKVPSLVRITLAEIVRSPLENPSQSVTLISELYKTVADKGLAPYQDLYNKALIDILNQLMNSNHRNLLKHFLESIELEELLALAKEHDCTTLVEALHRFARESLQELSLEDLIEIHKKQKIQP